MERTHRIACNDEAYLIAIRWSFDLHCVSPIELNSGQHAHKSAIATTDNCHSFGWIKKGLELDYIAIELWFETRILSLPNWHKGNGRMRV